MTRRTLLILLTATLLFGCSTETKQEPVAVEDRGAEPIPAVRDDSETQTYGIEEEGDSSFDALADPRGQLSVRIIYFEYDSSDIDAEYRPAIEAHAAYLSENSGTGMILEGHADERGSREYNLALGERRGQSVKRQMVLLGASASQIRVVSYGEERPAIGGHDEVSWQQNRRVEIIY